MFMEKKLRILNIPTMNYGQVFHYDKCQSAMNFKLEKPTGELPALDVLKGGKYFRQYINDPELCEYFVPVQWLDTVPIETLASLARCLMVGLREGL